MGRALTSPSRRMRPSRARSSRLSTAESSPAPHRWSSPPLRPQRGVAAGSRPCRHIPRRSEARSVLARWISALTAAVAAPDQEGQGVDRAARRSISRWIEFWPTTGSPATASAGVLSFATTLSGLVTSFRRSTCFAASSSPEGGYGLLGATHAEGVEPLTLGFEVLARIWPTPRDYERSSRRKPSAVASVQ